MNIVLKGLQPITLVNAKFSSKFFAFVAVAGSIPTYYENRLQYNFPLNWQQWQLKCLPKS